MKGKNSNQTLGVIEDNCSTDNYITFNKAKEMQLKGIDVILKIEGINTTEVINSKIYQVPIRDKRGTLHTIECYGLQEIARDLPLPDMENYKELCKIFDIAMFDVKRPRKVDLLLSAKSKHLMSDTVLKVVKGITLYCGPLGKTFFGTPNGVCKMDRIRSYPTQLTPVYSSVKYAMAKRALTPKENL